MREKSFTFARISCKNASGYALAGSCHSFPVETGEPKIQDQRGEIVF